MGTTVADRRAMAPSRWARLWPMVAPVPAPLDVFGPRSWTRPEVTGFGREPMAAPLARPRSLCLDGEWAFVLRDRPEAVTSADLVGATDGWSSAEVPGCWTMQGFDRPQYTNTQMPFPGPPPRVPDANPTGVYRRTVTVADDWRGQRIVVHVGGAESVVYVHLDGAAVGMGKDSRLPHEWDITDRVEPGQPFDLALTVVRWSDATYLEDQDHWYHAGLHRSVALHASPPVRIADVAPTADLDPETGHGHLSARIVVEADGPGPRTWRARMAVGDHVVEGPVHFEHPTDGMVNWMVFEGRGTILVLDVPDVAPWTAETPNLHDLTVTLTDDDGQDVDEVTLTIGFRRVEVVGPELRVNGRAVLIKGVNRHDHDPRRGKAVTRESIEADIALMKRHGINAVRTSHYPNDSHLYDVCDRLGMYVVDEANVETHAYMRSLTKDPVWAGAILTRVVRMVQRDRAHPSVVMWSLGNESGSAPTLVAAAEWLRAEDPSRPVHYEGVIGDRLFATIAAGTFPEMGELLGRPARESDVIAPMYPSIDDIVAWATRAAPDRPLIMCEYIHAMGNSCGSLGDYWDAIRTHTGLQGGFVWDWVDQALVQTLDDGTERLAYGGDFGDDPHDGPFCCNGLVAADRTPHPSLLEVAQVIAPVRITAVDGARGVLSVRNEHDFVDLSWLVPHWEVSVDGDVAASGALAPLGVGPGDDVEVTVPVPELDLGPGQSALLTLAFRTDDALPWAPAGHTVATRTFEVARGPGRASAPGDAATPARVPESLEPTLALWRAPIDNETFGPPVGVTHASRWEQMGLRDAASLTALHTDIAPADDGAGHLVTHRVTVPDGLDDIPRVGVRLRLGSGARSVEWFGRGPHEGYSDRRESTRLGRWRTDIDDWSVPYVHPQASGNRTGVRWLRVLDADGEPLLVVDQMDGLDVTLSRWTDAEVADAAHLEDLPARDDCYLWIDARHRGVGSGAVGPDVAPTHRVGPGPYRWSYRLR